MKNINKDILNKISTGEYKNINDKILVKYFESLDNYSKAVENNNLFSQRFHYNKILKLFGNPKNAAYILSNLTAIKTKFIFDKNTMFCYKAESYLNGYPVRIWTKESDANFKYHIRQFLGGILPGEISDYYKYSTSDYSIIPITENIFNILSIDLFSYINKPKQINGHKTKGFLFVEEVTQAVYDSGYKLSKKNIPLTFILKEDGLYNMKGQKFVKVSDSCKEDHYHVFNYACIDKVDPNTNIGEIKTTYYTTKE